MESSTVSLYKALLQPCRTFPFIPRRGRTRIRLELCQELVQSGADLDVIEQRRTPCIPHVYWDVNLIQFFLDHGRDIHARDNAGNTALINAASTYLTNVVEFLLQKSADPNVRNLNGETALYMIGRSCCIESKQTSAESMRVAKALIEGGADVNLRSAQGLTLLHIRNTKAYEFVLLDKFENIDIRASKSNDYENTPLMVAARRGSVELCRALIERNADVNAVNCYGFTPLHYAVFSNKIECVRLLLASGSDPNIKSFSGLEAFDMYRFIPSIDVDERIFDLFEDSIKKMEVYEMNGAELILGINIMQGWKQWKRALGMRTELNLPKPEPTEKQKTLYKIRDHLRTEEELEFENLLRDREATFRQAMLTLDCISNGSIWFLLRIPRFLITVSPNDLQLSLISEMLRHISENIGSENVETENEFDGETLIYFIHKFQGEFIRVRDEVTDFLLVSMPFVYNIYYQFLRMKWKREQVPTIAEMKWALQLIRLVQYHKLESDLYSHIKEFFTNIVNLVGLCDENGDTLLHLACDHREYYYCANLLVDCGANVKELNRKNQEPIQLLQGNNIDCNLVLKMVEKGAHLDAKPRNLDCQGAFKALKKEEINTLPYESLQCMAARVLARSFIHYEELVLPPKLKEFVNLHFYGFDAASSVD